MPINIRFPAPSERQELFLRAKSKYVAFGGARGGGKSWAVRVKAILLSLRYNGIRVCIIRKTFPELKANHIDTLIAMLGGIATYKGSEKEFKFPNGSVIFCRYCQNEKDLGKFQGQEFDVLFIDEATHFTEEMYTKFTACVRGVNGFPKRVYLTCNPGGVGHQWVKRLFIDRAYTSSERAEDYAFIQSKVTDNKALMEADPDYIKKLEALPPKLRKAWLEGDWDIFEGQFFEDFINDPDHYEDRMHTNVITPFEVPKDWKIYRSFDWGYSKPFSCDWWAIDYDGRAYLILQLYGCQKDINGTVLADEGLKWNADQVFREVHRYETEHRWLKNKQIIGVADPAIWARDGGEAIIEAADRHQVYFQKGDHQRIPGWMQCHYRLAFDDDGKPMVYFFNTCEHAIRTLPLLQYDEHKPEDLDTTQEDHFADSFRYFCMARPIKPVERKAEEDKPKDPLASNKRYKSFSY